MISEVLFNLITIATTSHTGLYTKSTQSFTCFLLPSLLVLPVAPLQFAVWLSIRCVAFRLPNFLSCFVPSLSHSQLRDHETAHSQLLLLSPVILYGQKFSSLPRGRLRVSFSQGTCLSQDVAFGGPHETPSPLSLVFPLQQSEVVSRMGRSINVVDLVFKNDHMYASEMGNQERTFISLNDEMAWLSSIPGPTAH
jgi:hypothetical protein